MRRKASVTEEGNRTKNNKGEPERKELTKGREKKEKVLEKKD